jgi:hypothetical protein
MKHLRAVLTTGTLLVGFTLQALGATPARYRVDELAAPSGLRQDCLAGFMAGSGASALNDLGIVVAGFSCFTALDFDAPLVQQKSAPFIAASWFGARALPLTGPACCSWASAINNFGSAFGAENMDTGGFAGAIWTLGGGHAKVFDDESCESIRFSAATGGNGRYTIGWGFRTDPSLPIPFDTLCLTTRWLFHSASGVETPGPLFGTPTAINAFDVAVGTLNRGAVTYHVPTGRTQLLHAADDAHSVNTSDINDLGEATGWIAQDSQPGVSNTCDPGSAVRWSRTGVERALPNLPGTVSSRAWSVGYDGETVGQSGQGEYCTDADLSGERAVMWVGTRVIDLNTLIPPSAGITLTVAASVNRLGQIAASGYYTNEPLSACPQYVYGETGAVLTPTPCHRTRVFLLTPRR